MLVLKTTILLGAALALFMAPAAFGGVVGSNHDMIEVYGLTDANAQQGTCSFCHVPHNAGAVDLFPSAGDPSNIPVGSNFVTASAGICYLCHSGGITAVSTAQNHNPFVGGAHGAETDNLLPATWGDISAIGDISAVYRPSDLADPNDIGCLSCHEVHDNSVRPFMRENTLGDPVVVMQSQTLCDDCHQLREQQAGTGTHTNHPTQRSIVASGNASIYAAGAIDAALRATAPLGTNSIVSRSSSTGWSWNLGGKLWLDNDTFDCGTCHAVHGNETATWGGYDGDATQPVVAGILPPGNQLVVLESDPIIAAAAATVAPICTGCHDITDPTSGPGSGGESHSYEEVDNNWAVAINTTGLDPATKGLDPGDQGLVCQSCHDMHFASNPRTATNTYALMANECGNCHTDATTKADHHPSGMTVGTSSALSASVDADSATSILIAAAVDWANVATADVPADNKVRTGTAGEYPLYNDGSNLYVTCGTCHGGGAGSKAHNTAAFPGLTTALNDSSMCVDCHGLNPSDNTSVGSVAMGSHYLGPVTTSSYRWGLNATAGAAAKYGPTQELVCESCHNLRTDSYGPYNTTNAGDNEASTADSVSLVLLNGGNSWVNAAASDYLCTGCHDLNPGTGSTHPINQAMGAVTGVAAATTDNFVTTTDGTATGEINCESCHRPHNADTEGGTKILEVADSLGSAIDEQVLCSTCHTDK